MVAITKREYLLRIIKQTNDEIKIFNIPNIEKIIPKLDEIDLAEVLLNYSYYFAIEDNWETNTKLLLNINSIVVEDKLFLELYPIIKKFLTALSKVC